MSSDPGTGGPGNRPGDQRHVLPESSSLIILLILFGTISVVTLGSILAGKGDTPLDHKRSTQAFGPADFDEIDFNESLLPELSDAENTAESDVFPVPPPPFSNEEIFPCSECHADMEVNPEPRILEYFHEDIELDHGPADRWCFDCHNPEDRNRLRLINGTLIGFDESYRLCGQCHGTIFRDWRNGIHGRRRGFWNGPKSYLLCAHCHNPHSPAFKGIEPLPPPVEPAFLRQDHEEDR